MFRMEFHCLDAVEEDDDRATSNENEGRRSCKPRPTDSPPKVYEGRVGQMQRVASSNEAMHPVRPVPPLPVARTRSLNSGTSRSLDSDASQNLNLETSRSLNSGTSIPRDWVEVDLIDFSDDTPKAKAPIPTPQAQSTASTTGEQEVLRELVEPFADSVNLTSNGHASPEPSIRDLLSNGVEEGDAAGVDAGCSGNEGLRVWTDSVPSTTTTTTTISRTWSASSTQSRSESSDAESTTTTGAEEKGCVKEGKGSPASHSLNKALKKFRHHNKSKPGVGESKPWDEPLLMAHEQAKLERKAQKEAEAEAKRMAVAAKKEAETQQRQLLELASPVPESSMRQHGMRKGIHKLFYSPRVSHSKSPSPREGAHGDVRESKLVMPRVGMFEASPGLSPSTVDAALAQIRSAPRPAKKSGLKFATVESNQRDVQPWTMDEYMAKNAKLEEWESRESDEEFGGIEGHQLLNQAFNNDTVLHNMDDSDSSD